MKIKSKYEDLMKEKLGSELVQKLFKEDFDKETIVMNLKKNLESLRDEKKELTDKLYNYQV